MKNNIYVAILTGKLKDNYIAIGSSESEAKERIIEKYFEDTIHTEADLNSARTLKNIVNLYL